jgi:hypothetical protein
MDGGKLTVHGQWIGERIARNGEVTPLEIILRLVATRFRQWQSVSSA